MPEASRKKKTYDSRRDDTPYSQCGCDIQAHFGHPLTPKLRVYHEDASISFHLPECSTHGSLRPKTSKFIDPDRDPDADDPYQCCTSDNDADSSDSVTGGRTMCMVYDGHEPSFHFQNCLYAKTQMEARAQRHDKKLKEHRRQIRLMKTQRRQQDLELAIATELQPQPEKRKRSVSKTPEPTFFAISGFTCDPESETDDPTLQDNLFPVYDDQSTISPRYLNNRDAYNLASGAPTPYTQRPVLVEKANYAYTDTATTRDQQYDSRTIASDVLDAMGVALDTLSPTAPRAKKRRVEKASGGVEGQEYSQFTAANASLDQRT